MTLYRCPACHDHRMVLDDSNDDGIERYRPCEHCNRDAWERWSKGHYEPNHVCDECLALARGRKLKRDD